MAMLKKSVVKAPVEAPVEAAPKSAPISVSDFLWAKLVGAAPQTTIRDHEGQMKRWTKKQWDEIAAEAMRK